MEGNLRPYIPDLTIRDYNLYVRYSRGVRRQLRQEYGFVPSLLMRHDCVVMALFSDSLAGREATCRYVRGLSHPFRRKPAMCQTKGIRLAAQMHMILLWRKLDDVPRERMTRRMRLWHDVAKVLFGRPYRRAVEAAPGIERLLAQERAQAEAQGIARAHSYEIASEPMANAFEALYGLAAPDDANTQRLSRYIGRCEGRIFGLLQMAYSADEDRRKERYNVFAENGLSTAAALENARRQCSMEADNLAHAYNILDVKLNRALLDNIFLVGLRHTIDTAGAAGQKKTEETWEIP
jgi:hypothetical protein